MTTLDIAGVAYLSIGAGFLLVTAVKLHRRRRHDDWGLLLVAATLWPALVIGLGRRAILRLRSLEARALDGASRADAPRADASHGDGMGAQAPELRSMDSPGDDLVVVTYVHDPDSFGWAVAALFRAAHRPGAPRWGTLDACCTTEVGAPDRGSPDARGHAPQDARQAVRRLWHLVDWHRDEAEARAAFAEIQARRW